MAGRRLRLHQRPPRFGGFDEGGGGFFLEFLQFTGEAGFGGGVHAVDEEDAVEMVNLVLRGAGEEAGGFEVEFVPGEVARVDGDFRGAANLGADFRDAEAAFGAGLFPFGFCDGRIDENQGHRQGRRDGPRLFAGGHINDGEQNRFADLLRGQADAVGGVHGLHHIRGELAVVGRDVIDALALLAQDRVTILDDFQNHGRTITRMLARKTQIC